MTPMQALLISNGFILKQDGYYYKDRYKIGLNRQNCTFYRFATKRYALQFTFETYRHLKRSLENNKLLENK